MATAPNQMQYVTRQPSVYLTSGNPFHETHGEWTAGLFDCFDDLRECLYAYFCSCCFLYTLGNDIGESSVWDCCIPNRVAVYRMKVRSMLKIRGSALDDWCVGSCCGFCAALQMKLELKHRGLT